MYAWYIPERTGQVKKTTRPEPLFGGGTLLSGKADHRILLHSEDVAHPRFTLPFR